MRIAIAGLRHGHIFSLAKLIEQTPDAEIVAVGEDDAATRNQLAEQINITHDDVMQMIEQVDCDAIAIGDYYGRRGALAIHALSHDRHVISDKPLATSLEELEQIRDLARHNNLAVGCQLDLCMNPNLVALRHTIREGRLGEIHQINFGGQHPLMWGSRPNWYFEPGKHGGTINDIAIHAIHLIPWLTGLQINQLVVARTWNAFAKEVPHFHDAAQIMFSLSNNAGIIGDVSYAMPGNVGYSLPQYWRFTVYGEKAMAEVGPNIEQGMIVSNNDKGIQALDGMEPDYPNYFDSFRYETQGQSEKADITTADVLIASFNALTLQQMADKATTN